VGRFLGHLGHPDRVARRIEIVEGRRVEVELIAQDDDEMAQGPVDGGRRVGGQWLPPLRDCVWLPLPTCDSRSLRLSGVRRGSLVWVSCAFSFALLCSVWSGWA
jgi:hypothetical protein